ncbi:MAG TPA: tetratricopeptide repeat protein [Vicinamibacteria bacterium]|nr:tetratricopeptide repeat protein [Vicinamibacteria bacterium]
MTALGAIALLVATGAVADPRPGSTPEVAATLAEARVLINQGKPREALTKLEPLDPGEPRVSYLQGVAYYHADDHVKAIDKLKGVVDRLTEDKVEHQEAIQVLGLSLYLAGRLPESVPYLEQTRAWAADNPQLAYILGNAYLLTQKPELGRASFARLFGVPAESAAAHLLAAQMMVRLELEEPAYAELQKAIEMDPRIPQAHYLLGQAAIFRGQLDLARTLLLKELELSPGHAMALYRLGDAYTREARWDEAIVALQKSIWLSPYFSGPYILLGKAYMKKGQAATAEGMLRRAVEYDPNNKAAHYLLGQLLLQAGRTEEAQRELAVAEKLQAEPERR